jgi:hypothetical protein
MIYVETDSIGPILKMVQAQVDSPDPCIIEVGRKGELFTILLNSKDADAPSDGKQREKACT